ncbi:MAG: hypothetical protein LBV27_07425 [Oscillospiraceae bacterium]|nr:hypothetical protein [Oscillospiraceae bacterium]
MMKLDNISRAAVVPVWADERVQYLAAFLTLERQDGLKALARTMRFKELAAAVLPAYMIPRKMIVVDSFPLNTNGKIDKKSLAARLRGDVTP